MFFLYNLERQVTLHPSYFGRNMHELVTGKLLKDVEGTCTGRYFIITIMDTFNISEGRILPGSGLAEFTVGYRAVVWRPFKGETVSLWFGGWLLVYCSYIVSGRCHRHVRKQDGLLR
jgi:DNA-directed RNA polymerase II subunit RPB7